MKAGERVCRKAKPHEIFVVLENTDFAIRKTETGWEILDLRIAVDKFAL